MTHLPLDVLVLIDDLRPMHRAKAAWFGDLARLLPPGGTAFTTPSPLPRGSGRFACPVKRAPTFFLSARPLVRRIWRAQMRWLATHRKPGLILAAGAHPEGALAAELAAELGVPYVVYAQAPELVALRPGVTTGAAEADREVLLRADAIIVPNRASWLEAYRLGILPNRLQEVPPGIDLERFQPGKVRPDVEQRWRQDRGSVVLSVTDGSPSFDFETVLRAFAVAQAQRKATRLLWVAPAAPPDLAKWIRELGLQDSVRQIPSPSAADLPELYRLADAFLVAHREVRSAGIVQGTELSLLQAMASGLVIVATQTPATEEWIEDESIGIVVESGAHTKLGKALADVLRSREQRADASETARRTAEERFDVRHRAAAFREFLEVLYYRRLGRGDLRAATAAAEGTARSVA